MSTRILLFTLFILSVLLTACTPASSPEMVLTVTPSTLAQCALASIHVHIGNTGRQNWVNYLLLFTGMAGNDGKLPPPPPGESWGDQKYYIAKLPLSLTAGQTYESDIHWWIWGDYSDANGNAQVFMILLDPDKKVVSETSAPVEFVKPTISLTVSPNQLSMDSEATITIQVTNPSAAGMACFLWLSYGTEEADYTIIKQISVTIKPNETFQQEIPWKVDYIETYGDNTVEAVLLVPYVPSVDLNEVTARLLAPEKQNDLIGDISARVPIIFSQP
jgi:hypothetical protein